MERLPKKITPCPIFEAVVELRFDSNTPSDAIFGIIYNEIRTEFPTVEKLPILQVPEAIRSKDPNLIYQAHYALHQGKFIFKIGPKVLIFSNLNEYMGWEALFPKVIQIINKINNTKVIERAERIGIRYINLFKYSILEKIHLDIRLTGKELVEETTNLRTELTDGDYLKIVNIANNIKITSKNYNGLGSLIDIDCIYEFSPSESEYFNAFEKVIDNGHEIEKQTFFSLLKEDFLADFNPEY